MKKWFTSRTLWVNIIAAVAVFIQSQFGYIIPPEFQAYLLVLINMFMRAITKTGLTG